MNEAQFLLNKLAEECSEVIHNSLKTSQFGFISIEGETVYNNLELCHTELDGVQAVLELLNSKVNFTYTPNRTTIEQKKKDIEKYLQICKKIGTVK